MSSRPSISRLPGIRPVGRLRVSSKAPVFSVVLPTYNRPELLRRAIASVCQQTFRDFELIVIDDGSRISCDSVLSDFPCERIRLIRNRVNLGVAASRNTGVDAARGKYISFLDDDDEYYSAFLASTYDRLNGTPAAIGVSWCSVEYIRYGQAPGETHRDRREFATVQRSKAQLFETFLSIGMAFGVTFKAACLKKVGRFDAQLKVESDTDLFLRVLAHGFIPAVVPGIHVVRHDHHMDRLKGPSYLPQRIQACQRFLREYSHFMRKFPNVRLGFLRHLKVLKTRAGA